MKIGIDMRMAGTGEGIGRYAEELVKNLMEIDLDNQYTLIFMNHAPVVNGFVNKKRNFQVVYTDSKYYSWAEQMGFVAELKRLKLDLVHFPSFNSPVRYRGKFVVTIHDLIHHHYPGKKKIRLFHRLAYKMSVGNAINRSEKIIVVSESTKKDILKHYKISADKIAVIYEGISDVFKGDVSRKSIEKVKEKYGITKPYILFVGAWRRYKNVPQLARAFDIIRDDYHKDMELVLVGKEDVFYPDIKDEVFSIKNRDLIRAPGFVSDKNLSVLYHGASVFVLPSKFEGFGLIAVEAQASGVQVVVSNIEVLREVLGNSALYFNPESVEDIADKVVRALDEKQHGNANVEKYDWKITAMETLKIYNEAS